MMFPNIVPVSCAVLCLVVSIMSHQALARGLVVTGAKPQHAVAPAPKLQPSGLDRSFAPGVGALASSPAQAKVTHHHHVTPKHHRFRRVFGLLLPISGINDYYGPDADKSVGLPGEPAITGNVPRCRTRAFLVDAEAGGTSTV